MSSSDVEMEQFNLSPRWSVCFEQGNAILGVSPEQRADLADAVGLLYSPRRDGEEPSADWNVDLVLTNQDHASITTLCGR
jgi:hypothetical protein